MKDDKLEIHIKKLKKSSREDAIFGIFSLVFATVVYLTIQSLCATIAIILAIITEKIGRDKDGK